MDLPSYAQADKDGGFRVLVWVQPGAKKEGPAGVVEGRLKVKLRAQALENKANQALVAFLAARLGIPRSALELTSGLTSRKKTVRISAGETPDWQSLDEASEPG